HIPANVTLVVYMPGYAYEVTKQKLLRAGLGHRTPCAVISRATSAEEKVYRTTIASLDTTPSLPAPTLLVVGDVVRFADHATLRERFASAVRNQIADFDTEEEFVSQEQEQVE